MTDEKLDEIEKLAEDATPDPWCVVIRGDEVTIETAGIECFVVAKMPRSDATDVHNATFIRAMREYALPLVKALREAWEIIDQYERKDGPMFQAHIGEAKALMERDEARAEVKQLREVIKNATARLRACGYQMTDHAYQEMADVLEDLPTPAEEDGE